MTRIPLSFIHEYRDRHGKLRRYVRRPGQKRVPLPGVPGSAQFNEAYQAALAGLPHKPKQMSQGSLAALAAQFFLSVEFSNLKPASQTAYRTALAPILHRHGHRLVCDMPREAAHKIIQEIGAKRPGMANLTRAVLRRMFAFSVKLGHRETNPFQAVARYKLGSHHTWTDDQLAAFEARWPLGTRERLAYALLLYTGQRAGDVAAMKRADIRNDTIHVIQEKTNQELYLALHPALIRAIKAGPANGLSILGDRHGRPLKATARLSNLIQRAAKEAGLPPICRAHGLRKAALRRLAEHGSTSKQIQAVSGHRTLTEVERYTRQADQRRLARAAIETLPDEGSGG